jgi:hypothetical protein
MKPKLLTLSLAAALALSACGRDEAKDARSASGGSSAAAPVRPQAATKTTPADIGAPQSMAEKREGANPTQQQVDPKERVQHRDFRHPGDAAGPRSPETAPSPGS